MKHKVIAILLALFFLMGITGCGTYYQVKDPASGNMYYTEDIDEERGGAIKFKDAKTKSNITLQNSEVTEIPKEEFKKVVESTQ